MLSGEVSSGTELEQLAMTAIFGLSFAVNFNGEFGIVRNVDMGRHSLLLFLDSGQNFLNHFGTETTIVVLGLATTIGVVILAVVRVGTIVVGTVGRTIWRARTGVAGGTISIAVGRTLTVIIVLWVGAFSTAIGVATARGSSAILG